MESNHHTLHVLSIDFDLFQNVELDTTRTAYPDGVDLPTQLSSLVWQSHYANPESYDKLRNVTANTDMIDELKTLIEASVKKHFPDTMICNSHKYIYDFIHETFDNADYTKISIDHLDMHHDLFNNNPEVDCGNWLSHIKKEIKTNINWIANPISKDAYGLNDAVFDRVKTDFSGLKYHTWDIIFLCRSDNWLPPHLDDTFTEFALFLIDHSMSCKYESDILTSRWTPEYQQSIKQLNGQIQELKANL